jgi:hypothetical protein
MSTGVPASRIIQLGGSGSGLDVEQLLVEAVYLRGVNEVLARVGDGAKVSASVLKGGSRSRDIAVHCASYGIVEPGKTAVAAAILEQDTAKRLTAHGRQVLLAVHKQISTGLDIPV